VGRRLEKSRTGETAFSGDRRKIGWRKNRKARADFWKFKSLLNLPIG
jgi:hypothetical protein